MATPSVAILNHGAADLGIPRVSLSAGWYYSPEYLEPLVRLEAMIDARIDKALARLLSLKEYKRIAAIREPPSLPPAISTPLAPQPDGDD
jgi:hypothetical protein